MKKLAILPLLLAVSYTMTAQTIVDTIPHMKNAIIEQFNGGPWCPDAHRISDSICSKKPMQVFDVRYYEFSSLYNTIWGDSISSQASLAYYPMGTINRHLFGNTSEGFGDVPYGQPCTSELRGNWARDIDSILSMPSPINIAATASIDETTRQLTVFVEVYYTSSSSSQTNMLNVLLLQNNLLSSWNGATQHYPGMVNDSGEYRHMHVFRNMLTGQWGETINTTTAGTLFSRTYYYTVPDSIEGVPIDNLCDIEVVAFVSEGKQEIISGCRAINTRASLTIQFDTAMGIVSTTQCLSTGAIQGLAAPFEGYRFVGWDNGSTNNPEYFDCSLDTSVSAIFAPINDEPQICMVSVQDNNNVVMWNSHEGLSYYKVYREGNIAGQYDEIAEVTDGSSSYVDTASRPSTRSYRYRISGVDEYGFETPQSVIHKTMHLTINQGLGGRWNLQWTPYEGAEYTTYIIYRGTNASDLQQIDIMPADGNTSYTDETATSEDVYYQVGIVMSTPCSSPEEPVAMKSSSVSLSNIATNSSVGINDIPNSSTVIFSSHGKIQIDGSIDGTISVYDMYGRMISESSTSTIDIPSSGVYLVKVGNHPAIKVLVVK